LKICAETNNNNNHYKQSFYTKDTSGSRIIYDEDEDRIDLKLFRKTLSEKQRLEPKKGLEIVNQKISDSLRELCLPKLLCEIAAKPIYMLSDKEKHVLSLLKLV
jgi:hypothetical protein